MLTYLKQFVYKFKHYWAGSAPPLPARAHNPNLQPGSVEDLPPFTGSAEEAMILLQMPPIAKVKRIVLTKVGDDGSIPDSVEELRLTQVGKVIARTDFALMDDYGQIGRSDQLKGRCTSCFAYSFQGAACQQCQAFTCTRCGGAQEGRCLCPRCAQDNWALYDYQSHKAKNP